MTDLETKLYNAVSWLNLNRVTDRATAYFIHDAMKAYEKAVANDEQTQGADARPVATSVIDHCWKMYQQGQISADHTAKEVFAEVLQSFANWFATRDAAPSDALEAARATADHIGEATEKVSATADHRDSVIEECCAAIKAEDDRMADEDYMLDSNDRIRVCRALRSQQDAAIGSRDSADAARWRWLLDEHFPTADNPPLAQVVWKSNGRYGSAWVNMIDGNDLTAHVDAAIASPRSGNV